MQPMIVKQEKSTLLRWEEYFLSGLDRDIDGKLYIDGILVSQNDNGTYQCLVSQKDNGTEISIKEDE
jgi:hypothetical protein